MLQLNWSNPRWRWCRKGIWDQSQASLLSINVQNRSLYAS